MRPASDAAPIPLIGEDTAPSTGQGDGPDEFSVDNRSVRALMYRAEELGHGEYGDAATG